MTSADRYRPGAGAAQRNARPDEEPSEADVSRIVREAGAGAGRPSLSAPGVTSPTINVRMPADLRRQVVAIAAERNVRPSEVIRQAVSEYVAKPRRP